MSILDIIKPIKLVRGSHTDIATTGQGCFMNVAGYLNGDAQITDESECVCVTIMPIAVLLNDMATQEQLVRLLPFIERAMGSATTDGKKLRRRTDAIVSFAKGEYEKAYKYVDDVRDPELHPRIFGFLRGAHERAERASSFAKLCESSGDYYATIIDVNARCIFAAVTMAACYAERAANSPEFSAAQFERGIALMDEICPAAQETTEATIDRAKKLMELTA